MVPGESTQTVPEDEGADSCIAVCIIIDTIKGEGNNHTLKVRSTTPGSKLLQIVGCACNYEPSNLVLTLLKDPNPVVINDHPSSTIETIGLACDGLSENHLVIQSVQLAKKEVSESINNCTEMEKKVRHSFTSSSSSEEVVRRRGGVNKQFSSSYSSEVKNHEGTTVISYKQEKKEYREEVANVSGRIRERKVRNPFTFMEESDLLRRNLIGDVPQMQADVINAYYAYQASEQRPGVGETDATYGDLPRLVKTERGESDGGNRPKVVDSSVLPEPKVIEPPSCASKVCVQEPEVTESEGDEPAFVETIEAVVGPQESEFVDTVSCVTGVPRQEGSEPPSYSSQICLPAPEVTEPPPYSPPENSEQQELAYVGLVNQAMTCYLNSLLQTLFMTPEFRNALYRWEFDSQENEVNNLPFQLQKLFLQLQVSKKPAIGTTELTTSFGWDSSEAWQQHDVQELCRVMFDALEQRFTNTDQADLISRLYEGKMKDYVRCLECGYESAREDTFLDVPLVVKPFGSNKTYGSVEEALQAFIAPETLDGSNQYFCERCDKKCDAHKGLKFLKFPYLLTLQLKRFDFDPNTMHRIKLNDKVIFPEILNLTDFVETETELPGQEKLDDADMTDSGSGFDDDPGFKNSSTVSSDDVGDMVDVDEGIDLVSNGQHEVPADEKTSDEKAPSPYEYELFSIMVHSGSANGGHYFAHIKSFTNGQWYCFNDVQVAKITYDDIRRTYGGGNARGYSSAYSSSANAYMLMYRQLDKNRNAKPMEPADFPQHLKKVLEAVEEMEQKEREKQDLEKAMCKFKLFCMHPEHKTMVERKLMAHKDNTLADVTGTAYELMGLNGVVPYDCCRLVKYDSNFDSIEVSLEEAEGMTVSEVLDLAIRTKTSSRFDILLEIKNPDEEFISYKPGGTTIKVFTVNLEKEELSDPVTIRSNLTSTVEELRQQIAKKLGLPSCSIRMVFKKYNQEYIFLTSPGNNLETEGFYRTDKVYVEYEDPEDALSPFCDSKFSRLLNRDDHTMSIYIALPTVKEALENYQGGGNTCDYFMLKKEYTLETETDMDNRGATEKQLNLERNGLGSETVQECRDSAKETGATCESVSSGYQGSKTMNSDHSENSSLSSLTDSERTLVGDEMSPRNNSPVLDLRDEVKWDDVPPSSFNESNGDWYGRQVRPQSLPDQCAVNEYWDDATVPEPMRYVYFKIVPMPEEELGHDVLHARVDKRMTLGDLKKQLEPYIGISADNFKLYRVYSYSQEFECTRLMDNLTSWSDGSKLRIKLGRALQKGEYRVKVYQLSVNSSEPCNYVLDVVFCKGMTVLQAKMIIAEIWSGMKIPLNRCRLRKKNWKNPGTVFLDSQKFEYDIPILDNWEVFVELLSEPEQVTNATQLSIYLRIWHPATLQLSPFTEIVLSEKTIDELLRKSSEVSGIPIENLEFAKGQGTFPCEMYSLTMHTEMEWHSNANSLSGWPLYISEDGSVLCCRDKMEELKELSAEEKRELSTKENSRFTKASAKTIYSPQKEKALKIYMDSPPASAASRTIVPAVPVE